MKIDFITLSLSLLKYLLSMLVSHTTGSCSFPVRSSFSSPGSTSLSQCCSLSVHMPVRSCLMGTLNGANSPIGSNTQETGERIFFWVIGASTALLVPLHNWRLSSVTFLCSSSTEDPSVLGSTSTCFVLLIDFKSSEIALVTALLLLIHFFSSNLWCERRCCSWLTTLFACSVVSTSLMKSFM